MKWTVLSEKDRSVKERSCERREKDRSVKRTVL